MVNTGLGEFYLGRYSGVITKEKNIGSENIQMAELKSISGGE